LSGAFERNTQANYFGVGEAALAPLSFRGEAHATYAGQLAAASAIDDAGIASPLYNHYQYQRPTLAANVQRELWGETPRLHACLPVQRVWVKRRDGETVQGIDATGASRPAILGPTQLGMDCAAQRAIGCEGGWNGLVKIGLAFDTRDFEPDPRSGV